MEIKKALIVDDNIATADYHEALMTECEESDKIKWECDLAYTAKEAFQFLVKNKYDVVLMDLNLNDYGQRDLPIQFGKDEIQSAQITGVDIFKMWRKEFPLDKTPWILVTAYAAIQLSNEFDPMETTIKRIGFAGYISKQVGDYHYMKKNVIRIIDDWNKKIGKASKKEKTK